MRHTTQENRETISRAASVLGATGGRIGGKARTPAKRKASRKNGQLGGRPLKPWRELSRAGRYARKRREQANEGGN